jgi:hypothetical protein
MSLPHMKEEIEQQKPDDRGHRQEPDEAGDLHL